MSTDLLSAESDLAQQFESYDAENFHVEFTEKGDDLIYHFWPQGDASQFPTGFARHLEAAFQDVLPSDADVHADFTDIREATVQHMHGTGAVPKRDFDKPLVVPRATYYVRVVGCLKNPLADIFLKGRVFTTLEKKMKEN